MVYTILAGLMVVLAFFVILVAGRLLLKGSWLFGWIKGMSGIVMLVLAIVLALAALDFYSYKQISKEQDIATLSFSKTASQVFQVSMVDSSGVEIKREIKGDVWQLDARIIKWNNTFAGLGFAPGYRLDRLSGRYYELEKEQSETRSVYQLTNNKSALDLWSIFHRHAKGFPILDATYGSATYLPMEDGALFSVALSNTGLVARPLNSRAKDAVDSWQ